MSMNIERLSKLMDWMNSTPLSEFEWNEGKEHIKLVKAAGPVSGQPDVLLQTARETAPLQAAAPTADLVVAPFPGIVHLSAEPGAPDYVSIGTSTAEGDTLCTIEAMKVFNAVVAPHDGIVTEILVTADEQVALDQPLFRISRN